MLSITQYVLRTLNPRVQSILTRILYMSPRVKIGTNFRTDSVPRMLIDPYAQLHIGNDVEFRADVEIRVHGNSSVNIGDGVRLDRGIRILAANSSKIEIGSGVRIGIGSVLNGGDSITIGDKVLISGFVYLQTSMHGHKSRDILIQDQGYSHAPVIIGTDAWLGAHVVIMPGINVGAGAIVGSNAVVTADVDPNSIVTGIPAKVMRLRDEN